MRKSNNEASMQKLLLITFISVLFTACSGEVNRGPDVYDPQVGEDRRLSEMQSLITKSDEPLIIYGDRKKSYSESDGGGGVANSYLWKAALESISFMPLIAVDSRGGAILTDWYSSHQAPNEKFKFNIIILSPELQINSIRVHAFKQVKNIAGQWHPVEVSKELARNIEDNILRKAISLKAKATSK